MRYRINPEPKAVLAQNLWTLNYIYVHIYKVVHEAYVAEDNLSTNILVVKLKRKTYWINIYFKKKVYFWVEGHNELIYIYERSICWVEGEVITEYEER